MTKHSVALALTLTAATAAATVAGLAAMARADAPADEKDYYVIEDVEVPKEAFLEVGGLAFSPDGTLYVTTRRGEVWAGAPGSSPTKPKWRLFASGLHEALGVLALGNGDIAVAQRPELTRLRDTNRDGVADRFETLTDAFGLSGNYHEYHFGPVRDRKGNLYGTLNVAWEGRGVSWVPYRGWMYKLTPKGEFIPFATGFRSPAGLAISPEGDLFVTDNQGDWVATSPLLHVKEGEFHGHPAGLKWTKGYTGPQDPAEQPIEALAKQRKLPAAWFPYGSTGHSPTEPIWDTTKGKFGPFAGQMLVGDQTKSFILRVALEKVGGEYQGAVFPFRRGFASGILRLAYGRDNALYVGETDRGWGATGGKVFALQRLVWTGKVPFEVHTMSVTKSGFDLTFTKPIDRAAAKDPAAYSFQHYSFKYWKVYGSPHVETTAVAPVSVAVSSDGKRVSVTLPPLVKERVYELHLRGLRAEDGTPLLHQTAYYTLNRLP